MLLCLFIVLLLGLLTQSVTTTFDNEWDVLPAERAKLIHGVGGVCKFSLNIQKSPYTGIFKNGRQIGIIRLGSATDMSNKQGVVPGAAIKFLRTGRSSGNFVALDSLDPIPNNNYNFFAVPLTNHIPSASNFQTKAFVAKFKQASKCVTKVGLSDLARYYYFLVEAKLDSTHCRNNFYPL